MKRGQEIGYRVFKLLVEQSKDPTIILSEEKKIIYISPNSSKILGFLRPSISKANLFQLIHPENVSEVEKAYSGKLKKTNDLVVRVKKNGNYRWYNLTISKLDDGSTSFTFRDIHKKTTTEEKLKESEEKYKLLFDKSPFPKWIYNRKTHAIVDANEAAIRQYGYSRKDFKSMTIKDIRPKDDVKKLLEFEKIREPSMELTDYGIWRHQKKNGEIITVQVSGHPIKYNNKDCNVAVCIDVTEKERNLQRLQENEEFSRNILSSLSSGIAVINKEGTILRTNDVWENNPSIGNKKPNMGIGTNYLKSLKQLANSGDFYVKEAFLGIKEVINKKRNYFEMEYPLKLSDNTIEWLLLSVSHFKGKTSNTVIRNVNITEKKNTEQILKKLYVELEERANSLTASNAELEQFAYIASHDLQEPLRMVTSFLGQIEKRYSNLLDEKGKKYIHFAVDGAQRMRQLIIDLLEYSKLNQSNIEKAFFNVDELLKNIIQLNSIAIKQKNAKITIGKMPDVYGVESSIQSVFQNLISNALKYQKKNVQPIIKIKSTESSTHWQFSISDNGVGIDSRYFDRIFLIFQRLHNKEDYSGTGIGLAVCQKIIAAHKGKIWLKSIPGKGSTFYFTIKKSENKK